MEVNTLQKIVDTEREEYEKEIEARSNKYNQLYDNYEEKLRQCREFDAEQLMKQNEIERKQMIFETDCRGDEEKKMLIFKKQNYRVAPAK